MGEARPRRTPRRRSLGPGQLRPVTDIDVIGGLGARAALTIGALLSALVIITHKWTAAEWLVLGAGAFAFSAGVVLVWFPRAIPLTVLDALLLVGDALLGLLGQYDTPARPALPGLYLVIGTIVFAVRPWRVVSVHVAMLGASYAGVLIWGPPQFAPYARWVSVMTTIMVVGIFVRWLVGTVTGLAAAEHNARGLIEAATAELELENRKRTRFLARMSHELRTPLNVVLGFSDLLSEQIVGPLTAQQREYVRDVSDSARHLVALVDDVLDLQTVETGDVRILPGPLNPALLVTESIVMVRDRASAKSISITLDVPEDLGAMVGDRLKLRQVLVNLLANAVRFTPPGGSIVVSARQRANEIELAVDDTGPGVDPEDRERIFEEYGQSRKTAGGTGLGLALARRFVALHGGAIWVQDRAEGGSSFRFSVPRSCAQTVLHPNDADPLDTDTDHSAFVRPGSRANRALVGRISARLVTITAIPALTVALLTPYPAPVRWAAGGSTIVFLLAGRLVAKRFEHLSFSQVEWCGWFGIMAICIFTWWGGEASDTIPFGFAWITMIGFALWPRPRAIILLVGTGVLYAGILVHLSPPNPVTLWLATMTLLTFNAETVSWVTSRLRALVVAEQVAHRDARRLRAQLTAASRHKSSFVANMSHELRTPLNAVIGFTDLLSTGLAGPLNEQQQEYIRDIGEAARHLLAIINDVLDTAKLEAGQLELNPDVLPLRSLLERAIALGNPPGPGHLDDVRLEIEPGLEFVVADRQRLEQVLVQLISNAVKFTLVDGHVAVSARTAALGEIHIAVADSGIGIMPEQVPRIFDAFHQGTRLPADHIPAGTGLGLSLAKSLIEMHAGRIWVTSRPDRGSTFTVALPGPAHADRPLEQAVRQLT